MGGLHDLSALEQAAAMRRGELRPLELVEHYLARIERLDATLGAFVTVTAERAREAAQRAERRLAEADPPPLCGVTTAIKDLNGLAGVATSFGTAAFPAIVAPVSDHVAARVEGDGLVVLGKTNTPEFGLPCYTEPDVALPARCPFDLGRSAGGSSGGAAAAVAGGLVALAHGSDGAGSIRIPASACGLVGLKPSRGRVSAGPRAADPFGLVVHGPIARTVADAAALLDAMAGPMPGDPFWAPPPPGGETFLEALAHPPARLHIGVSAEPVIIDTAVDPRCLAALEATVELLESLGHRVSPAPRPFSRALTEQFETLWAVGAAAIPVPADAAARLRPLTQWLRRRGEPVLATAALAALGALQDAAREAVIATSAFDAVLTPTLAQLPAPVGALRDDDDPAADFAAQKRFTPFTAPANLTGQPAISLPLCWSADGLPIGVQLVGRPAGEAALLQLAGELEAARPWRDRQPACW
ncbi:MAG: amidase [Actinomycetota bacterium]|nr:amidase [Actinomycetota bacterium]